MLRGVRSVVTAILAVQLVSGCGGGGKGETDADVSSPAEAELALGPGPAHLVSSSPTISNNLPPVFQSSGVGVVRRNDPSFGFYSAEASDPEGAQVTYQISGGSDAGNFTIDPGYGVLSFLVPPNADLPSDANGDNVYLVKISASDGFNRTTQDTVVTVSRDSLLK
jgi:hypothetical protein